MFMRFLVLIAILAGAASGQHSLWYCIDQPQVRNGGGNPLDEFSDEELISVTFGPNLEARKVLSVATHNAMVGDEDGDSRFYEDDVIDEMDAIARHPLSVSADPTLFDFVFSSQDNWGQDFLNRVDNGSVYRFKAPPIASTDDPVQIFVSEGVLQVGLGTLDGLDVDALAFGSDGTLYISFNDDELILGNTALLQNGAIAAFLPGDIQYDSDQNIQSVGTSTIRVVIHEAALALFIANANIVDGSGSQITTVGNLQGLEIDPSGGTFTGDGGTSWPNFLISTSNSGPRILTTAAGGAMGMLNGQSLGDPNSPDLTRFGLDGIDDSGDISSIAVIDERDTPLVAALERGALSPSFLSDTLAVGNGTPFGTASLALISIGSSVPGATYPASDLGATFRFPGFYTFPLVSALALGPLDSQGRKILPIALPPGLPVLFNVLIQGVDLSGPVELSAPIVLSFDPAGP